MRYWLSRGEGEVVGPFTRDELAGLAARGELAGPSGVMPQVCPEGEATWRPISMVPELASLFAAAPAAVGASAPSLWPPSRVPGADPLLGVPFEFGTVFDLGWKTFKANYGMLLGVTAIMLGVMVVGWLLVMGLDVLAMNSRGSAAVVLRLFSMATNLGFSLFISTPLSVGALWFAVRLVRGEAAQFGDILMPYRRLLYLLATSILVGLLTFGVMIPGLALVLTGVAVASGANGSPIGVALLLPGLALAILAAVVVGVRMGPSSMLVIDPQASPSGALGPIQAMAESWRITRGFSMTLIGIGLAIGGILIACLLACGLPAILFGYPLCFAVYGAGYALLVKVGRAGATA